MGATWFKHDVDAVYDPKVRKLIRRYGAEGYGRYWALLEALAKDADGLEVASEEDWSTVAEYCLRTSSRSLRKSAYFQQSPLVVENCSRNV